MKTTKTERRMLAVELGKARRWTDLKIALAAKTIRKTLRSGSHRCKCGQRISTTKPTCLACKESDASQQ